MHPLVGLGLVGVALYLAWPKKTGRGGKRLASPEDCPSYEEIDGFGRANDIVFAMVQKKSEMHSPEDVWRVIGQPIQEEHGWSREKFFDRFAYFVAADCTFWVSTADGTTPWRSDGGEVLELLREWQRTGKPVAA